MEAEKIMSEVESGQAKKQSLELDRGVAADGEDTALRSALDLIKKRTADAVIAWNRSPNSGATIEWARAHNWSKAAEFLEAALRTG